MIIVIQTLILTIAMLYIAKIIANKIEQWRIKRVYGRDLERRKK